MCPNEVVQNCVQFVPASRQRRSSGQRRAYGGYLVVRGHLLYFRYVVPVRLQFVLGCTEIRRTLHGATLRRARAIAAITGSRLRLLFDNVGREVERGSEVDRDKLTKLVHMILDEELDRLSREIAHRAAGLSAEDVWQLQKQYTNVALSFSINPWDASIQTLGQELIDKAMNGADSESAQLTRDMVHGLDDVGVSDLRQAIIKARETAHKAVAFSNNLAMPARNGVHDELDYFFPRSAITNATVHHVAKPAPQQDTSLQVDIESIARVTGLQIIKQVTLREAIDTFVKSKRSNKERSLDNKRLALKEFELAIGENAITREIDIATIERFIQLVHNLPNRRGKQPLRSDIWSYIDNPEEGPRISRGTVRTKLAQVKTLLHDMKRRGFIAGAVVDSACYAIGESCKAGNDKISGRPFEFTHLEALFNPDKFLPYTSLHGDDFWIPLIGLFTGARLDEIVRLQRKDIKRTPAQPCKSRRRDNSRAGLWYMDITSPDKSLKNAGSYRVIPLHSYLFEIGLDRYLSDFKPDDYIFSHYGKKARNKALDMFLSYRRIVGVGLMRNDDEGEAVNFHSFRHTVANTFKDRFVPDTVSREIMGHSPGKDVHASTYEKAHSIETLHDKGAVALDTFVDSVDALKRIKKLAGTIRAPWTIAKNKRPKYRTQGKKRSFEYPYEV